MRTRLPFLLLTAVCSLLLGACAGNTTGAKNLAPTSAKLTAVGTCETKCDFYFRIAVVNRHGSLEPWRNLTTYSGVPRVATPTPVAQIVTGLQPSGRYAFQICGRENPKGLTGKLSPGFTCVGFNGQPTLDRFETPAFTTTPPGAI